MQSEIKKFIKEVALLQRLGKNQEQLLPVERQSEIKHRLLQAIAAESLQAPGAKHTSFYKSKWFYYGVPALCGVLLISTTAFAAGAAKPGEVLYPVKRLQENVILGITVSQESRAVLQAKFAKKRLEELKEISVPVREQKKSINRPQESKGSASSTVINPVEILPLPENITPLNPVSEKQIKLERKARQDADSAVASAIEALEKVKTTVKDEGRKGDEDSLNQEILDLKQKAKVFGFPKADRTNRKNQEEVRGANTQSEEATTTESSSRNFKIKNRNGGSNYKRQPADESR